MMGAGVPLVVSKLRKSRICKIVLLALLADQAMKLPVEALVQMPSSILELHLAMIIWQYSVLAGLILVFAKAERRVSASPTVD